MHFNILQSGNYFSLAIPVKISWFSNLYFLMNHNSKLHDGISSLNCPKTVYMIRKKTIDLRYTNIDSCIHYESNVSS